jgi:hypothetical protein
MSLTNEVRQGREASAVLENEAFKKAMEAMKLSIRGEWINCPIRDREGQLLLLQMAKLTDKFEAMLVGMINAGNFAQHKIDIDNERNESLLQKAAGKVRYFR